MSNFAAQLAEITLVKALQALLAQWANLDLADAQATHTLLRAQAARLQQASGRFEPVARAGEALAALDGLAPLQRYLAPVLAPARQAGTWRGIQFSDPALAQQILTLLAQLLQQPLPQAAAQQQPLPQAAAQHQAPATVWSTAAAPIYQVRPYPTQRSSYLPAAASRALPAIAREILSHWDSLDAATQADLCGLFWETASRLQEAATPAQNGEAAVWFLEQIELVAPPNAAVQRWLSAAEEPPAQSKGPVFRTYEPISKNQPGVIDLLRQAGVQSRVETPHPLPPPTHARPPLQGDLWPRTGSDEPPAAEDDAIVPRYGAVEFPARVLQRLATRLTVRLTEQQVANAANTITPMSLQVGAAHPVTVVVLAPDFVIFDAAWNRIHTGELLVKASGDSDPLIFELLPTAPGAKALAVDFRQNERLLGTVNLAVTVVSDMADLGAGPAPTQVTQAAITMPDRELAPPQLELRIKAADQARTAFEFILHSKLAGFNWKSLGVQQFPNQPAAQMASYFEKLNALARAQGDLLADADKQTELKTLGANLFFDAFPEALQRALWALPAAITDLIITSDEPWIPWELTYTFDPDTRAEGDFLCHRFHVARWLAGDGMTATLPSRQVTAIVPRSNLPFAAAELEALQDLQPGLTSVTDAAASVKPVRALLQSNLAGILHFACHGNLDTTDPTNSALTLSDGPLRAADLARNVRYRQHPLIFLNACESGGLGFALSGLGGWAERFVQAGAGAFVGALWEVNDALAAEFAGAFYNQLFQGATLGEAFAAARAAVRSADPNNPTWLAYVLYGEPLSKLQPS